MVVQFHILQKTAIMPALFLLFFYTVLAIPASGADSGDNILVPTNLTLSVEPFISIDPIENHTAGEVFFINGTTNLPVSETLMMYIESNKYATSTHIRSSRGPLPGKFAYNIPVGFIAMDGPGVNRWSVNLTDIAMNLSCDEYLVLVDSKEANAGAVFTLYPAGNGTAVMDYPTIMPAPSAKNSTAGDLHALPATQSSPLSFEFSIFALLMLVAGRLFHEKGD